MKTAKRLGQEFAFAALAISPAGDVHVQDGLNKRELFAAMIYAGMMAAPDSPGHRVISAETAVDCADALLAALAKEPA